MYSKIMLRTELRQPKTCMFMNRLHRNIYVGPGSRQRQSCLKNIYLQRNILEYLENILVIHRSAKFLLCSY